MNRKRTAKIGEIKESNNNGKMELIEYNSSAHIKIKFETGSIIKTTYYAFKNGTVKDPLYPSVYNIGYFGEGAYKCSIAGKHTKEYIIWRDMLGRCYDPYTINIQQTYKDAVVCKSWLNFQNFAAWVALNYYEVPDEIVHLDKDLMKKGNRLYHPKLCSFVPQSINKLMNKNKKSELPTGVEISWNRYIARICIAGKQVYIGTYNTPTEAFLAYKSEKEKYTKILANKYKNVLHPRIYRNLICYNVPID